MKLSEEDTERAVSVYERTGDVEKEERKVAKWKKRAKGKPIRWRMLRDVVALLTLDWMTTSQVQVGMRRLWALKNNTTRDILEELEMEQTVVQSKNTEEFFGWEATPSGVAFWVGGSKDIPALIARVAETSKSVSA